MSECRKNQIILLKLLLENTAYITNQADLFLKSRTTHTTSKRLLASLIKNKFIDTYTNKNMILYIRTAKGTRFFTDVLALVEGMYSNE